VAPAEESATDTGEAPSSWERTITPAEVGVTTPELQEGTLATAPRLQEEIVEGGEEPKEEHYASTESRARERTRVSISRLEQWLTQVRNRSTAEKEVRSP